MIIRIDQYVVCQPLIIAKGSLTIAMEDGDLGKDIVLVIPLSSDGHAN